MPSKPSICFKDAVRRGVIRIFVDGVRADVLTRGRKSQVDNANTGNQNLVQGLHVPFFDIDFSGPLSQDRRYAAVHPPSIGMTAPLMNSASLEHR